MQARPPRLQASARQRRHPWRSTRTRPPPRLPPPLCRLKLVAAFLPPQARPCPPLPSRPPRSNDLAAPPPTPPRHPRAPPPPPPHRAVKMAAGGQARVVAPAPPPLPAPLPPPPLPRASPQAPQASAAGADCPKTRPHVHRRPLPPPPPRPPPPAPAPVPAVRRGRLVVGPQGEGPLQWAQAARARPARRTDSSAAHCAGSCSPDR